MLRSVALSRTISFRQGRVFVCGRSANLPASTMLWTVNQAEDFYWPQRLITRNAHLWVGEVQVGSSSTNFDLPMDIVVFAVDRNASDASGALDQHRSRQGRCLCICSVGQA